MFPLNTRILIADDMLMMRNIEKRIFNNLGFQDITLAEDGEAALNLAKNEHAAGKPFGLIVSDWMMPKMKGIDFLRAVRANDTLKNTPFIMVTAEIDKNQVMEAVQAGVTQYISKPFSEESYLSRLKLAWDAINGKKVA
jgi:two-component system, chemotaxis family, chemotaxis protein CheY